MKMTDAAGIRVPLHGLVYGKDRSLAYFIKRFDRPGNRKAKLPLEDFAKLSEKTRETKYDSSVEKVVSVLEKYCTFPQLEKAKFVRRVLFSFLSGNEDMHLKNYSLITIDNQTRLSPVYDLLNTTIALKGAEEESALPIGGKKSRLTRTLLIDYLAYERLNLSQKVVTKILQDFSDVSRKWYELIEVSFLTPELKQDYKNLPDQRLPGLLL
jgi:serine/threonine-protein kinase HipA